MSNTKSTLIKVILGLIFLSASVFVMLELGTWRQTWFLIKGCLGPVLALAGIVILAIARE